MTIGSEEAAALVALARLRRHSDHALVQRVEETGSALAVLERQLGHDGAQTSLLPIDPDPLLQDARQAVEQWAGAGIRLLTVLDADYPANLRDVHDRPPLLFIAGALQPVDTHAVAVIGARRSSSAGLELAARFAADFVADGVTVLSGLAAGVDTAAHTATLDHGGRTVAVIGTGLGHSYPSENAGLQKRIAAHGAVISQFEPDAPPTKQSFPMRNAVMSGLSRGSVLIEASERSGARIQARLALAHGRPVFLLTRLLEQPWARELASRPGVHIVGSPSDVVAMVQ